MSFYPIAFSIGPLQVHWYGLLYGAGLLLALWLTPILARKRGLKISRDTLTDLLFWVFLPGVVLGGRLGYVLFYNLPFYLQHPAQIFAIWEGGMSFHGGLIGSAIVLYVYARKNRLKLLNLGDLLVIPGAIAQGLGRIGNFVNGELLGRPLESEAFRFLGIDFGDGVLRYPSQLFQSASLLMMALVLFWIFTKKPKRGALTFSYLILSGLLRFITEFWREPDAQIGFIGGVLTLGQILALLVLGTGLALLLFFRKKT